jgi:hypothetical protein
MGENLGSTSFHPATKRVFAFNLNTRTATIVDPKEVRVVGEFVSY